MGRKTILHPAFPWITRLYPIIQQIHFGLVGFSNGVFQNEMQKSDTSLLQAILNTKCIVSLYWLQYIYLHTL